MKGVETGAVSARGSSDGQSTGFTIRPSQVRILPNPPKALKTSFTKARGRRAAVGPVLVRSDGADTVGPGFRAGREGRRPGWDGIEERHAVGGFRRCAPSAIGRRAGRLKHHSAFRGVGRRSYRLLKALR